MRIIIHGFQCAKSCCKALLGEQVHRNKGIAINNTTLLVTLLGYCKDAFGVWLTCCDMLKSQSRQNPDVVNDTDHMKSKS